jgi:hypothetical protein
LSGYVRLYRSLFGHPAFRDESQAMAFAWMIGKASWRDTRVRYKGHSINLKRGQLAISVRDMGAAFDRDKAWIERLWKRLKSETMIETRTEAGVTIITICNYGEYQHEADDRESTGETPRETANETPARQRRDTEQVREEGKKERGETNVSPRGRAQALRLPDDWEPRPLNPDTVAGQIVAARGHPWEMRARESFKNHWRSANGPNSRKRDWQAAYANWVIEQDNRDGRRTSTNTLGRHQPSDGLSPTSRAALRVFGPD